MTDPWRRVLIRKVRKEIWEVLEELGEIVIDTVESEGEKGVINEWEHGSSNQVWGPTKRHC